MTAKGAVMNSGSRAAGAAGRLPGHELEALLCHLIGCSRVDLYATHGGPAADLPPATAARLQSLAARRLGGEPLQYLTGSAHFRSLQVAVGPGVLVPRPETEMLVESCLELVAGLDAPLIADIGTGSGVIAICMATERPRSRVFATDVSIAALKWARRNAAAARAPNLVLSEGDLFASLPAELRGCFDLVVSNPPYLSEEEFERCAEDVKLHEPAIANLAGPTGLEVHRRLIAEAPQWLKPGGRLVLETHAAQWPALGQLLRGSFHGAAITDDLAGRPRIAQARFTGGIGARP